MKMPPAAGGNHSPRTPWMGGQGLLRRALTWLGGKGRQAALGLCNRCPGCGALLPPGAAGDAVCPACAAALAPRRGGYCPRCGEMTDDPDGPVALCPTCRASGRAWDELAFHARYAGLVRELILDFKFRGRLGRGRLLGGLLVAACRRLGLSRRRRAGYAAARAAASPAAGLARLQPESWSWPRWWDGPWRCRCGPTACAASATHHAPKPAFRGRAAGEPPGGSFGPIRPWSGGAPWCWSMTS